MRLFLLTFFLVYGGMHLYAFLKVREAFGFGPRTSIPLVLFMVLMVIAPVLVRLSEKAGFETSARIMAYVGLTWGAILFLFFSASLVLELYRGLLSLISLVLQRSFPGATLSAQYALFIPLFVSLSIALYGFFEARDIHTERLVIRSAKIPKENASLKIVQISDVHLGLIVREDRLSRILQKVESEHPDILVSTGDLVDGLICRLNGLEDPLKHIRAPYGKFAITGNHEFYAGFEETKCFTERAGFTLLRGEGVTPGGIINIAGVDDPAGKYYGVVKDIQEKALLSTLPRDKFTLLLKHRPFVDRESIGLFDLQLSGHVHKGQIFPFSLITKLYYPLQAGFMDLPNDSRLYVSRGSGTWGPPIRFLSPPEVTVIELIHSD